jgi:hypothetical protein
MDLRVDTGNGYSLLFPDGWTQATDSPAVARFDGFGGTHHEELLVQTAAGVDGLQAVPSKPGHDLRDLGPIEVYGKTTFMSIYKLDSGGFELAVTLKWSDQKSYLFLFRELDLPTEDTAAFQHFLDTVIIFG